MFLWILIAILKIASFLISISKLKIYCPSLLGKVLEIKDDEDEGSPDVEDADVRCSGQIS